MTILCRVDGAMRDMNFLVDSQADICVLKETSISRVTMLNRSRVIDIKGITNAAVRSLGALRLGLVFDTDVLEHEFHVVPSIFNIDCDGIIGKDFLLTYNCKLDYESMLFSIRATNGTRVLRLSNHAKDDKFTIPPRCEVVRVFRLNASVPCVVDQLELAPGVFTSRTIVDPGQAYIRVINTTEYPQTVTSRIDRFEALENFWCYSTDATVVDANRTDRLKSMVAKNTPQQYQNNLMRLVEDFPDVFALPEDRMTVNNFYTQKLRTIDDSPSYIKNYRTPNVWKEEIRSQVNRLIENDLIEPCASSYNSPVILVPKKSPDGMRKWRMCLDYRGVNKKLVADKYPLPRIDDILDNLGRAVFFSVMDLYSGFHQVPVDPESRDLTAFSTEQGSFRWKVLPFGLNVSPNSFSRMMQLAFSGLPPDMLFIYIDDIIVLGRSEEEHLINLRETFRRCRERNLKLNPDKCSFFRAEVLFLGHLCTSEGIRPDRSKYSAIAEYPRPNSAESVRRFVAMANYYRKFVPGFSVITIPLNRLTKKNVPFVWNEEHQIAFDRIKQILSSPQTLAYPDFTQEFVLTVDASKAGCGAVLSQNERPIAYASKGFNRAEGNKSTIEQELIAMHWAIKHFRYYLYGRHFLVRSDHRPLIYLYNLKESSAKLTRLRLELAEYTFSIEHIRGKDNVVADALSRVHVDEIRSIKDRNKDLQELNVLVTTRSMTRRIEESTIKDPGARETENVPEPKIAHEIKGEDDDEIPVVRTRLLPDTRSSKQYQFSVQGNRPAEELFSFKIEFANEQRFTRQLLSRLEQFAEDFGISALKIFANEDMFQVISPNRFKSLGNEMNVLKKLRVRLAQPLITVTDVAQQRELVEKFHEDPRDGGHFGIAKTLQKLRSRYFWSDMSGQVRQYVMECHKCQVNKPKRKTVEPLTLTDTPSRPFYRVSIDTVGPMAMSEKGSRYALSIVCDLTKYLIMLPMKNKEARTIARAMFEGLILVHGPVEVIVSDQGTEFVNAIMRELCGLMKIEHRVSAPYHHQTMGSIERTHRVFNEYLRSYLSTGEDWEECMKYFVYCYNTAYHAAFDHRYTPFELVFGRRNTIPDFVQNERIDPLYNLDDYVKEARYRMQVTYQAARRLLELRKNSTKSIYDRNINPLEVKIGDKVLLRNEARGKHESMFRGPYLVVRINEPNVEILDEKTNRAKTVHKNNVSRFRA